MLSSRWMNQSTHRRSIVNLDKLRIIPSLLQELNVIAIWIIWSHRCVKLIFRVCSLDGRSYLLRSIKIFIVCFWDFRQIRSLPNALNWMIRLPIRFALFTFVVWIVKVDSDDTLVAEWAVSFLHELIIEKTVTVNIIDLGDLVNLFIYFFYLFCVICLQLLELRQDCHRKQLQEPLSLWLLFLQLLRLGCLHLLK